MNSDQKTSKLTKVLIHKTHGGRKKDSKFWNDDIDISYNKDVTEIPIERKPTFRRRASKSIIFPAILVLSVTVALVIARPDLFPFLDYHKVYDVVERLDNIPSKNIEPKQSTYPKSVVTIPPYQNTYGSKPKKNNAQTYNARDTNDISLEGMVFSWKDKNGKRHFSNTNYPKDNPTLQVQSEINTYKKITKVRVKGNRIYVPVTLKNDGYSITLWMLLDTGCSHTNVSYAQLNRINAKYGRTIQSRIADGSLTPGREAFIDMMQIGSQKERNVRVTGSKVAGSANSGLLGLDFLKNRVFKIDYDRQMLVWM